MNDQMITATWTADQFLADAWNRRTGDVDDALPVYTPAPRMPVSAGHYARHDGRHASGQLLALPTDSSAWIAPNGDFYYVHDCGHSWVAESWNTNVGRLEDAGWVHLSFGNLMYVRRPTAEQYATLVSTLRAFRTNRGAADYVTGTLERSVADVAARIGADAPAPAAAPAARVLSAHDCAYCGERGARYWTGLDVYACDDFVHCVARRLGVASQTPASTWD